MKIINWLVNWVCSEEKENIVKLDKCEGCGCREFEVYDNFGNDEYMCKGCGSQFQYIKGTKERAWL